MSARHFAGLGAWLVVVALLVLGAGSGARLGRSFWTVTGLLGFLALLSALSSLWSGSVELSVIEADRALAYLGFFLAAFLIAQTAERRHRFAEGLVIGVTILVLLGLASRLLPNILEVAEGLGSGPRLRYPLEYWNANAALCGIAVPLLLWMSRGSSWTALRWASAGVLPAVFLTMYFTYSRGGIVSLAVGSLCILALSRDRLWLLGTLLAAGLGALPALLALPANSSLADNFDTQTSVDQGVTVLLILLAGIGLTLVLFALLRRLESARGAAAVRVEALSRDPTVLKGLAATIAVLAIVATAFFGGRAWNEFTGADIEFPKDPSQQFSNLGSGGRDDFWRVAVDSFEEEPLVGTGAGTYEFAWERERSIDLSLIDAHSLYLESFAELGLLGGLAVIALVLGLIWIGLAAWRAAPYPRRETLAALLAAMLVFAVGVGYDWFWEMAALAAIFFLAAGALVAARCAQISTGEEGERRRDRRFGIAIAGVAIAWIAAIALIGPLLVEREIEASRNAFDRGDLINAVDHADTARSIEPWAASPYLQLGLLAEAQGEYDLAARRLSEAIDREENNWELYALRSRVHAAAGEEAAARADLERARALNPLAPQLREDG